MDSNDTNVKEKLDSAVQSLMENAKTKRGKIIGIIILVIVFLNTFWNMVENKIVTELQVIKTDLTAISSRLSEVEKGTPDVEAVKADAENIRKAGADFESRLSAVIKAEEEKLAALEKSAEDQKNYLENLKGYLAGETGR